MQEFNIFSNIDSLPSISSNTKKSLYKLCGSRVIDIVLHIPTSYIDRRKNLSTGKIGDVVTFIARVEKHEIILNKRRKGIYNITLDTEVGQVKLIFFNYSAAFFKNLLPVNAKCLISGKLTEFLNKKTIVHPDYMERNILSLKEISIIEPIYKKIQGINNRCMFDLNGKILQILPDFPEWVSPDIIQKHRWSSFKESLIKIHMPLSLDDLFIYKSRIIYDELLAYLLALRLIKNNHIIEKGHSIKSSKLYNETVLRELGFELTNDQIKTIKEITADQEKDTRMIRLLQGDVGSGKTVVALFAMLNVIENNHQVAFMVPTEILAEQHYNWLAKRLINTNIDIEILTGKTKQSCKKIVRQKLSSGECKIVIGTHALFQEKVSFKDLKLIIIDEQQRFGVIQRMSLMQKGENPDILFMTATPIPRTLQQVLYGNMLCSYLIEKPKCRTKIHTTLVKVEQIPILISRLKNAIESGAKAYWICPYIEESLNEELSAIAAVEKRFVELNKALPKQKIGIIHGRLTDKEKDSIMKDFYTGKINLIVATTVIEVGIDVPDATIMIIENAEQFGLSQLHQLRGRVGRSNKLSFCVLLYQRLSKISRKRLLIIRDSQDGFYIAEQDMILRGSGDVFGLNQSGLAQLKFADIFRDKYFLEQASLQVEKIMEECSIAKSERYKNLLNIFGYNEIEISY